MCTICPRIFVKLDFLATMSQMGSAYSARTGNILSISDISPNLPCFGKLEENTQLFYSER